jgi:hypothetical protein
MARFVVQRADGAYETVVADYFRVNAGALTFVNAPALTWTRAWLPPSWPACAPAWAVGESLVVMFAPGQWLTVDPDPVQALGLA